jgi:hypothetical protein
MTFKVKFYKAQDVYASGIGVRRDRAWQYYLPFKRVGFLTLQAYEDGTYPGSTVGYALPLSNRRLLVASRHSELALIDLPDDRIIARSKIGCMNPLLQTSADRHFVYIQNEYSLFVLDADTLRVLQDWQWIEQTGAGWARYSANDAAMVWQSQVYYGTQQEDRGTIDRLNLVEPVLDMGGGKLSGRFVTSSPGRFRPSGQAGSYIFDIATGAVERLIDQTGAPAGASLRAQPPSYFDLLAAHPRLAALSSCLDTPPTGPPEFQALVAREAMVTLIVADDSRGAAIAVLDDLAVRMERDLESMILCDSIHVRLLRNGNDLDFGAFCDRFVQNGWREAVPLLRRILLAYLHHIPGGDGNMPWSYKGWAPAEAGQPIRVLRALVMLDSGSQDVYRLYIAKGDLEHDTHPYELYGEYVRCHGVRNESDISFGIYLTVMGCNGAAIDTSALMDGAAHHVTPERFADLVMEALLRRYLTESGGNEANPGAASLLEDAGRHAAPERVTDALRRIRIEWDYRFDVACLECLSRAVASDFSRKVIGVLAARLS